MLDSESVHGALLRCHWNLSHLKGFIRGERNEITRIGERNAERNY